MRKYTSKSDASVGFLFVWMEFAARNRGVNKNPILNWEKQTDTQNTESGKKEKVINGQGK